MKPIYSLRGLQQCHGARTVLHIERLDLAAGHIYSLVGPNGAGKSTLLQILAFLTAPSAGTLRFAGEAVRWNGGSLKPLRRQATLVHQAPYLFNRSVYHNLSYGLGLRGIFGQEQRRRIGGALERVGLGALAERQARQLSGGEAQRVAIARALVLEPKVLLLDEPTANIDSRTIAACEELLRDLPQQGTTVIMASHDPAQPQRLGSELLRLEEGRLA